MAYRNRVDKNAAARRFMRGKMLRFRAIVIAAKAVPCFDCGRQFPSYVMDLDHRNPFLKKFTVSQGRNKTEASLHAEIAKCDVVCANCHRERTHGKARD